MAIGTTVISLLPKELREFKPGLRPEEFIIPAAPKGGFSFIHVSGVKEGRKIPLQKHLLVMDKNPAEVAESIVSDYTRSVLGRGDNAQPGIFWVEGCLTEEQIRTQHIDLLAKYRKLQRNWFMNLVTMADNDFARTKQPKMVSDLQRFAASDLGLKRDWQFDESHTFTDCPACMEGVKPTAVVCSSCGYIIDKVRHKAMFPEKYIGETSTIPVEIPKAAEKETPRVPEIKVGELKQQPKKSDESILNG